MEGGEEECGPSGQVPGGGVATSQAKSGFAGTRPGLQIRDGIVSERSKIQHRILDLSCRRRPRPTPYCPLRPGSEVATTERWVNPAQTGRWE